MMETKGWEVVSRGWVSIFIAGFKMVRVDRVVFVRAVFLLSMTKAEVSRG